MVGGGGGDILGRHSLSGVASAVLCPTAWSRLDEGAGKDVQGIAPLPRNGSNFDTVSQKITRSFYNIFRVKRIIMENVIISVLNFPSTLWARVSRGSFPLDVFHLRLTTR